MATLRLATFKANGRVSYGAVTDIGIVDLGKKLAKYPSLLDVFRAGAVAEARAAGRKLKAQLSRLWSYNVVIASGADGTDDVLSTATWSILSAPEAEQRARQGDQSHWIDIARMGIQLARKAIAEAGREGEAAVAFAISEEVNSPRRRQTSYERHCSQQQRNEHENRHVVDTHSDQDRREHAR